MKFVMPRKIKEVMADVIFHIILKLRKKFEFTRAEVKRSSELVTLKMMMLTWF
jgi:hypothetical protein